jgi:hypothetical protein
VGTDNRVIIDIKPDNISLRRLTEITFPILSGVNAMDTAGENRSVKRRMDNVGEGRAKNKQHSGNDHAVALKRENRTQGVNHRTRQNDPSQSRFSDTRPGQIFSTGDDPRSHRNGRSEARSDDGKGKTRRQPHAKLDSSTVEGSSQNTLEIIWESYAMNEREFKRNAQEPTHSNDVKTDSNRITSTPSAIRNNGTDARLQTANHSDIGSRSWSSAINSRSNESIYEPRFNHLTHHQVQDTNIIGNKKLTLRSYFWVRSLFVCFVSFSRFIPCPTSTENKLGIQGVLFVDYLMRID